MAFDTFKRSAKRSDQRTGLQAGAETAADSQKKKTEEESGAQFQKSNISPRGRGASLRSAKALAYAVFRRRKSCVRGEAPCFNQGARKAVRKKESTVEFLKLSAPSLAKRERRPIGGKGKKNLWATSRRRNNFNDLVRGSNSPALEVGFKREIPPYNRIRVEKRGLTKSSEQRGEACNAP